MALAPGPWRQYERKADLVKINNLRINSRTVSTIQRVRLGMIMVGESAARACAEMEDFAARQEAAGAPVPRSFGSVDAMHWTPPAEGQEVPPCLA